MRTIVLTAAIALLSLSSVAASAYPYYGHRYHRPHYRHSGGIPGPHIIGSGDRHGTASGGPVGGFKTQP